MSDNKRKNSKRIITAAAAVIIIGTGAAAAVSAISTDKGEETVSWREYKVSKGDITVGITESGTVSLDREAVTAPCMGEILEVYVRTGMEVSKGDPLLKISSDDITDYKTELEEKLLSAENALAEAQRQQTVKTIEAQQLLESSIEKGASASAEYDLFIQQKQSQNISSQQKLDALNTELGKYEEKLLTYDDDYAVLSAYETKLEEYEEKYKLEEQKYKALIKTENSVSDELNTLKDEYDSYIKDISEQYEKINELKKNCEAAKEKYEQAYESYLTAKENTEKAAYQSSSSSSSDTDNSDSDSTNKSASQSTSSTLTEKEEAAKKEYEKAYTEYCTANTAYSGYYVNLGNKISDTIEDYEERVSELEDKLKKQQKVSSDFKSELDELNEEISEYREKYNDYSEDYRDIYGNDDKEAIEEKITELKTNISDSELNIRSTELSSSENTLQAQYQAQTAIAQADTAQEVYDSTIAELKAQVSTKQREYDDIKEQYDEFCENVSSDGIISADCSGVIGSVYIEEGDNVNAQSNIVTIMNRDTIYLSTSVSEEDITSLEVGQDCTVNLTSFEGKSLYGEIDTISAEPARSSGSVTYTVTVKLDTSGLNVLEGMSGEITFIQGQAENVLYTNLNAVSFKDGVSYVTVYDENGAPIEKEVITGFTDGRNVEISQGVQSGDTILAQIALSGGRK